MHPSDFRRRFGKEAEEKAMEMILICTQALYKSRKTLPEKTFDHVTRTCKKVITRSANSEQVRHLIGEAPQQWKDFHDLFALAIPVLEAQSLAAEVPHTGAAALSSALMALNHDTLMKDLERLNDILIIARNVLATTQKVQDLAGESQLDQQILKLIDLCVRVTARGYDGDSGSRTELQWGNVITSYKKLLVTCLQFLYNFVQENEQRKLLLWLDLFANSKVANECAAGTLPSGLGRDHLAAKSGDFQSKGNEMSETEQDFGLIKSSSVAVRVKDGFANSEGDSEYRPQSEDAQPLPIKLSTLQSNTPRAQSDSRLERMSINGWGRTPINGEEDEEKEVKKQEGVDMSSTQLEKQAFKDLLNGAVKAERGDEFGALRTPQSAAITLQEAKDQLMARLADTSALDCEEQDPAVSAHHDEEQNGQGPSSTDGDDGYKSPGEPGDQERGLLTDIPLVLAPQEIEALPMLIQIGICAGQEAVTAGRDMQGMRCNILLAGEPGRNLLRELLIFIAAWDLQDDEMYFKYMMKIMGAILENGLMPYAYQTFAEVKDIVSPAQSMVIKILTQIFRNKHAIPPTTGTAPWTAGNVHADASRRVDIHIVRYIFTIFRQCIIPETCALIYLQGQIKAGHALPEDFPLNLWDMERVYEGVYQFLEFFAVLTESEQWKDLLVNWEIVSELVTLLRELEASIPKASLGALPQTAAEAQQTAVQQERQSSQPSTAAPTPVAVERPFDVAPTLPAAERPFEIPPPTDPTFPAASPLSQSDSQDQDAIDASDACDFEWRNLKKLVILVLSSLVWKSTRVQDQIRQYGGVEMVLACCCYDGNNPYIKEHAIMCLRFVLEGCEENQELVRSLERAGMPKSGGGRGPVAGEHMAEQVQRRAQPVGKLQEDDL